MTDGNENPKTALKHLIGQKTFMKWTHYRKIPNTTEREKKNTFCQKHCAANPPPHRSP